MTPIGMTLIEAGAFLADLEDALRATYPGAFPREVRPAYTMMPARADWEVQITAATSAITKAAEHLRKAAGMKASSICPGPDRLSLDDREGAA